MTVEFSIIIFASWFHTNLLIGWVSSIKLSLLEPRAIDSCTVGPFSSNLLMNRTHSFSTRNRTLPLHPLSVLAYLRQCFSRRSFFLSSSQQFSSLRKIRSLHRFALQLLTYLPLSSQTFKDRNYISELFVNRLS